ncbi:hypothetical protein [Cyclobacterium sp. 1_MG-2023]|uniref:hypothetical protein n=1 Tax=Cyclobacterium sp. 1_MG-2023 TaxID=3062681 RepID=UPI0026E115DB|nr:hypothetical protein [Cyclobacterium sp. 1_MG-2023]
MNISKHIASQYLAAYFMVVPLLFGVYTYGHSHYQTSDRQEAITIDSTVDCSLCDLYESQTAYIHIAFFSEIYFPNPSFYTVSINHLIGKNAIFNFLRGPPVIS